jgi:hypothetical protein
MNTEPIDWSSADHEGLRHSQALNIPGLVGARPMSLWLPPDFERASEAQRASWPLAVFFDGQNLFGDQGTLAGGWHMHQILKGRQADGKAVPVVLGIHHGPERDSEMSPFPPLPGITGKATAKLSWLVDWLLPQLKWSQIQNPLDQNPFKLMLSPDPEQTLIGGSSLGGLLALYALFHYPQTFGKALVMSPALWPDRFAIFQDIMLCRPHPKAKIYLDHGQKEIQAQDLKEDQDSGHTLREAEAPRLDLGQLLFEQSQLMADLLEVLGFVPQNRLYWNPDPEGEHNERAWRRRLPVALDFLYGV